MLGSEVVEAGKWKHMVGSMDQSGVLGLRNSGITVERETQTCTDQRLWYVFLQPVGVIHTVKPCWGCTHFFPLTEFLRYLFTDFRSR